MTKNYTPTIENLKERLNALNVTQVFVTDIEINPGSWFSLRVDDLNTDGKNIIITGTDAWQGKKVEIKKEILNIEHHTEMNPMFEELTPETVAKIKEHSQVNIATGPDWHYKGICMTFSTR